MDQEKQQLLERIRQLEEQNASMQQRMASNESVAPSHTPPSAPRKKKIVSDRISNIWHVRRKVNLTEVFSFIGAFIVFIGVVILISVNWEAMSTGMRLVATLGTGVVVYCGSIICFKHEHLHLTYVGYALYIISAFVIPFGFFVFIGSVNADPTPGIQLAISGLVFLIHTASYFILRNKLCILSMLVSFSWVFLALTSVIFQKSALITTEIAFLQLFVLGLFYTILGLVLSNTNKRDFTILLYAVGTLSLLISIFGEIDLWSGNEDPLISGVVRLLLTSLVLTAVHIFYYHIYQRAWFLFASVVAGTGLFLAVTGLIFESGGAVVTQDIQFFQLFTIGLFYGIFGAIMAQWGRKTLTKIFYVGSILFLLGEFVYLLLNDVYTSLFGIFEIFETPLVEFLMIALALTFIHILYYRFYAQAHFLLASILSGTGVFFALTQIILAGTDYADNILTFSIRFFIVGFVYMLLGYIFASRDQRLLRKHISLSALLYFLGSVAVLVSGFYFNDQGGRDGNFVWEVLYPVFIMGFIALSVYVQSKITLAVSFIALMGYIALITSYFQDDTSFSWPVALIVLGFLFIGIGYIPLYLKRKFFVDKEH